jgi:hypothetical protein
MDTVDDNHYELYCAITDTAYDMAEIYVEFSDSYMGHAFCSDKGLKEISRIFNTVKDEWKVAVFTQFLEELIEREIDFDRDQFRAKVN